MGPEEPIKELSDEQKAEIKKNPPALQLSLARKNAARIVALARRKQYFSEGNETVAIATMLNSGLGRRGRRNLCKKLMWKWTEYKLAEETILAMGKFDIPESVAKNLGPRYHRAWKEGQDA